eukprot:CAMPEP_0170492752 /NCGR_PEP_ID=MMETSP0208-20121228/12805_1 /TAXON_ID=197538 /ORGANISM="Strombidium inclinatum, Strain S3" /LENGTH=57 /DNA_ID=CAMNT_0010768549 /DNA_START=13 /DNA_END=186 /DNA_ORIENTATION=-
MELQQAPVVKGFVLDFLTSDTFNIAAEALWGQITTFSASLFWGALEAVKGWTKANSV